MDSLWYNVKKKQGGDLMSIEGLLLCLGAKKSDTRRDALIPLPEGITEYHNIQYGPYREYNLLDVYHPEGASAPLPTIVSIHGGGYVYGTKEVYRRYCMDLARRGFAVVNFNYRLAPKWKFPIPLADINSVLQWVKKNAAQYRLRSDCVFLVGDSAGAQLATHYAAMHTNPGFAKLFCLNMADVTIRALGLNCGMYNLAERACGQRKGIIGDYLGKHISADDPRLQVSEHITEAFPPAFITTGCQDFLRPAAQPMSQHLQGKGIASRWKCYGQEDDKAVSHVFHVNILLPDAKQCNDDTADFFRNWIP